MRLRWLLLLLVSSGVMAQEPTQSDTTRILHEVTVTAFSYNRLLRETPVAIGISTEKEFNRFNNASIVSAMNTIPGVRMEERSPGSYRFSIRGSTLRSPFGVRDVKFYWNGLPLTDGGGNTYLNLLDIDAIGRAEIVKGPGASLYGAGTGGVALLSSPTSTQSKLQLSASGGSFGFQRYQVSSNFGNAKAKLFVNYARQQADGYRQQSAMRRDAISLEGKFSLTEKTGLKASLFYTDLYYQTPGGLTLAQYNADPKQARPNGVFPGAVQQQAAIYNKTIYGSSSLEHQWNLQLSSRVGVYGSYTDLTNPFITNYERRIEQNWGGRTDTRFELGQDSWKMKLTAGAEYQYFYSPVSDYGNRNGVRDTLQTDDRLTSKLAVLFVQSEFEFLQNFYLTVGGSATFLKYDFKRLYGLPSGNHQRNFDPVFSPRIAFLKKISESFSLYTSISKGFSAPSLAEVRPNTGIYNGLLAPSEGLNCELGFRGLLFKNFNFDIVAYDFELTQTIVSQNGGTSYVNSGKTSQQGLETFLSWQTQPSAFFMKLWTSYTFSHYKFVEYTLGANNYSGNRWTGSPLNTLVVGWDLSFLNDFYWNFTSTYVDCIPLNDANSIYAPNYFLIGSRIGFKSQIGQASLDLFAGIENALDQKYSLGNDINAQGNRFFNAAASRNFYFGVKMKI